LGEILRLVICELINDGVVFAGQNTYKLERPYSLDTAFLSLMESDPTDELLTIVGIFTHFYNIDTTLAERQFFRALSRLIGRRAARLSACGMAALVNKMGALEEGCSVGADGSLYKVRSFLTIPQPKSNVQSRNTLGLRIAYTRDLSTSSARRAATSQHTTPRTAVALAAPSSPQ